MNAGTGRLKIRAVNLFDEVEAIVPISANGVVCCCIAA
jgi:hypothetical protein